MGKLEGPGLRTRLAERYSEKAGWVLLGEVRDSTGWKGERSADAIAMGLWPSRGMEVHGFEIKISRGDFLRELKNAAKSAPVQKYCDRWWVVVADADIVHFGELPPTWGLMAPHGRGLRAVVEAPLLEAVPLDRGFIGSVLRNFGRNYIPRDLHNERMRERDDGIEEMAKERAAAMVTQETRNLRNQVADLDGLKRMVAEFEAASGVHLPMYEGGDVGAAVRAVLETKGGSALTQRQLDQAASTLERAAAQARAAAESLRKLATPGPAPECDSLPT
jgi:hypothetical protein